LPPAVDTSGPFSSSTDSIPKCPPRSRITKSPSRSKTPSATENSVPAHAAEAAPAGTNATVSATAQKSHMTAAWRNAAARAKQRSSGLDFGYC
jgi:hypothetical protein